MTMIVLMIMIIMQASSCGMYYSLTVRADVPTHASVPLQWMRDRCISRCEGDSPHAVLGDGTEAGFNGARGSRAAAARRPPRH